MSIRKRPPMGLFIYSLVAFGLGAYFTFAAVQGDYGLFRGAEVKAETRALQAQLDDLSSTFWTSRRATFWGSCVRTRLSSADLAILLSDPFPATISRVGATAGTCAKFILARRVVLLYQLV